MLAWIKAIQYKMERKEKKRPAGSAAQMQLINTNKKSDAPRFSKLCVANKSDIPLRNTTNTTTIMIRMVVNVPPGEVHNDAVWAHLVG